MKLSNILLSAAIIGSFYAIPVYAGTWQQDTSGSWFYYDNDGQPYTGWLKDNGSWYYLDHNGSMLTGTQMIHGVSYYFTNSGEQANGPGEQADHNLSKAPYVTAEMCTPEFWISTNNRDNNLLLTAQQIQDLNHKILAEPKTNTWNLSALPEVFDGISLRESLASFSSPQGLYLNDLPVPEAYYAAIRSNIQSSHVTAPMKIKYAIAVNHTAMKGYPYEDFLSDGIGDPEWDNFVASAVYVNEPLVVYFATGDNKFLFVKSRICSGWIPAKDVAICQNKAEWENAVPSDNFLLISGEKVYLETSTADLSTSEKRLPMGTTLELVPNPPSNVTNRMAWNNYTVKLPARKDDGSFTQTLALVPANRDVTVGYLPFTSENILRQAFKLQGNRYGWGGMLNSQDCSAFIRDIYRCFGLELPRNTTWQGAIPARVDQLNTLSTQEKEFVLNTLPVGSILQFPGHEMLYLGTINGHYYTINDVSTLVNPLDETGTVLRVRSVIVNDLSTKRKNGKTWLEEINKAIIPWE